ncbi:unnamed protein product [Dovyalis caffra]|uniref:HhH-GPD domain-containing protein n=1 Tax=Dovyalis caffra TaxID=77055 RepID=A0AAV1R546_9ROSI|nr:unnamed protein product [Dovyalis caffra]
MPNEHKRKRQPELKPNTHKKPAKTISNGKEEEPFPTHARPTPDECRAIRDSLLAFHGFPQEFAKYRKQRDDEGSSHLINSCDKKNDSGVKVEEEESVLDGLVKTVLSQNTTEVNSQRAFLNLKSAFPTWENVIAAESKCVENAIRCGGLASTKAACIRNILSCLMEKKGKLCLEYLRDLSVAEIKAELFHFKGIGPKTANWHLLKNAILLHLFLTHKKRRKESAGEESLVLLASAAQGNVYMDDISTQRERLSESKDSLIPFAKIELTPNYPDSNFSFLFLEMRAWRNNGYKDARTNRSLVACVLMFNLQKDDFPVDTHVFEIAKAIGWVPGVADRNKTYLHLNHRIPDGLKFDLNCLLYTHEVNPYTGGEKRAMRSEEGNGSGKSVDEVSSKMDKNAKRKARRMNWSTRRGHQNAHKKRRIKKKKKIFVLILPKSLNDLVYDHSVPSLAPFSSQVPKFTHYRESLISFNHSQQNQYLCCDFTSKSIFLSSQNVAADTYDRKLVVKPTPLYISKGCESLYIRLGLAGRADVCSSS